MNQLVFWRKIFSLLRFSRSRRSS